MKNYFTLIFISLISFFPLSLCSQNQKKQGNYPHQILKLTQTIHNQLVRLLCYSNEIDIKGIIATTSCWHKTRVDPESIIKIIQAYGKVQPNL